MQVKNPEQFKQKLKEIGYLSLQDRITEIQIVPIVPKSGLVAFASFVWDKHFRFANIGINTRPDGSGYRLTYPSRILKNGTNMQHYYPINKEVGETINKVIGEVYDKLQNKTKQK